MGSRDTSSKKEQDSPKSNVKIFYFYSEKGLNLEIIWTLIQYDTGDFRRVSF